MTQRPEACNYCAAVILPGTNDSTCCSGCEFLGCERCIVSVEEGQAVRLCDACRQEGAHRDGKQHTAQELFDKVIALSQGTASEYFMKHNLERFKLVHRREVLKEAALLECPHCEAGNLPQLKGKTWFHYLEKGEFPLVEMCQVQRVCFAMTREES